MKQFIMIICTVAAIIFTSFVANAQDEENHREICIECGGTGSIIVGEWVGDSYVEKEVPCPVCGGSGYIEEEPTSTENQSEEDAPTSTENQPDEEESTSTENQFEE